MIVGPAYNIFATILFLVKKTFSSIFYQRMKNFEKYTLIHIKVSIYAI